MSQNVSTSMPTAARMPGAPRSLAAGAIAGPMFAGVSLIQAFTRPGFDPDRAAISLLTLGSLGWIQRSNFIISGLLVLACAIGVRRALRHGPGGTWGALLLAGYGAGLIVGGIFTPDPSFGYPAGAPVGNAAQTSWHAAVHMLAFNAAFVSLVAATFVFVRRFVGRRQWGWALAGTIVGVAPFPLILVGAATGSSAVLLVLLVITSGWITALAARLRGDQAEAPA